MIKFGRNERLADARGVRTRTLGEEARTTITEADLKLAAETAERMGLTAVATLIRTDAYFRSAPGLAFAWRLARALESDAGANGGGGARSVATDPRRSSRLPGMIGEMVSRPAAPDPVDMAMGLAHRSRGSAPRREGGVVMFNTMGGQGVRK